MPPKDAFSDLFNHASGASSKPSLSSQMNNLSVAGTTDWDFDLLSPSNPKQANSQQRQSQTQGLQTDNYSSGSEFGLQAKQKPQNPSSSLDADLLAFFEPQPKQATVTPAPTVAPVPGKSKEYNLLGDDFTDAYQTGQSVHDDVQRESQRESQRDGRESQRESQRDGEHGQYTNLDSYESHTPRNQPHHSPPSTDAVLAALVSEGFSVEMSNNAISRVGPDFQKCVQFIVRGAVREPAASPQKDLGVALHDVSAGIYKKASWLFDKSKQTVIKNINNFQHQRITPENGMPAWIRDQDAYRGQASEKQNGVVYEDYGDEAENINQEEIQRIIRAQQEREAERRRERQNMARSSKSDRKKEWNDEMAKPQHVPGRTEEVVPPFEPSPPVTKEKTPEMPGASTNVTQVKPGAPTSQGAQIVSPPQDSVDLLGLGNDSGLSRAQKFKASSTEEIPVRRRNAAPKKAPARNTTAEALNAFQQSDYETSKAKASEFFSNGDYNSAIDAYSRCLESLPANHELRIVISSNVALTAIKLGNFRLANQSCDDGINLIGDCAEDSNWIINKKPVKYWFLRLLTRKAESLEMLENFPQALDLYFLLVSKHGVNDKKTMDAKRRVNNVVNPPKQKSQTVRPKQAAPSSNKNLHRVQAQHSEEKSREEQRFRLHDQVHEKVQKWSSGKEDNLRNLLMTLSDVLPQKLGFPFITSKKITINDLMLTKKVKINYMKVISSIHPDKLGQYDLEDQMICQATFVTLNKAWDIFKEQNNIS